MYRAYYTKNTGNWGGDHEYFLKFWKDPKNAWNAIAEHFKSFKFCDIRNLRKEGNFISQPPENYTFDMLVEDVRNGLVEGVTVAGTDFYFRVEEVKTED